MDAAREVLRRSEELLDALQTFAVETTLSGHTYLRVADASNGFDGLTAEVVMVKFAFTNGELGGTVARIDQTVSGRARSRSQAPKAGRAWLPSRAGP